jgi:hypothetical protein
MKFSVVSTNALAARWASTATPRVALVCALAIAGRGVFSCAQGGVHEAHGQPVEAGRP